MTQVSVRRVMVTGATGFIGSRVVRQLVAEGCEVIALTRPGGSTERVVQGGALPVSVRLGAEARVIVRLGAAFLPVWPGREPSAPHSFSGYRASQRTSACAGVRSAGARLPARRRCRRRHKQTDIQ